MLEVVGETKKKKNFFNFYIFCCCFRGSEKEKMKKKKNKKYRTKLTSILRIVNRDVWLIIPIIIIIIKVKIIS